jgi:hypothetical protein
VTLRSAPDSPRHFASRRQLESASDNSSRTHSSSDNSHHVSTSPTCTTTSGGQSSLDALRPSAHAACPRTSGSAAFRAAASVGTASSEPQFPSATATLRSSPRRFVRFTGEPLKRREKSSGVIHQLDQPRAVHPGAGQERLLVRRLSERVRGTDLLGGEDCPLPRFVIPLATGCRTLRNEIPKKPQTPIQPSDLFGTSATGGSADA